MKKHIIRQHSWSNLQYLLETKDTERGRAALVRETSKKCRKYDERHGNDMGERGYWGGGHTWQEPRQALSKQLFSRVMKDEQEFISCKGWHVSGWRSKCKKGHCALGRQRSSTWVKLELLQEKRLEQYAWTSYKAFSSYDKEFRCLGQERIMKHLTWGSGKIWFMIYEEHPSARWTIGISEAEISEG